MRFDKYKNPAACVATGQWGKDRPALTGVCIVDYNDERYLASTDGHALVMVRAHGDRPAGYRAESVHADAIVEQARRETPSTDTHATIREWMLADRDDRSFPDAGFVCRQRAAAKTTVRLHVNAELLLNMQRALGCDAIAIEIAVETDGKNWEPLVVRPMYHADELDRNDGSFGLVMPIVGEPGEPLSGDTDMRKRHCPQAKRPKIQSDHLILD